MANSKPTQAIIDTLNSKSALKMEVFAHSKKVFAEFRQEVKKVAKALDKGVKKSKGAIVVEYIERGEYEVELRFAGDVLIFYLHTNVFRFEKEHPINTTKYIKKDPARNFYSMISIYNFLSDSFKYNRTNDLGYLIARIFVNREQHFLVEGERPVDYKKKDFGSERIDAAAMKSIIENAILDTLDFDLLTPPYDKVKEVTVDAMKEATNYLKLKTGKRMGFTFQADKVDPE
ncbi:MAG: hypothetical protein COB05_09315 [Marinobacter sp.]|nr:MAG: hypothetical protein COB05_09315 [Marinobacter sp.]